MRRDVLVFLAAGIVAVVVIVAGTAYFFLVSAPRLPAGSGSPAAPSRPEWTTRLEAGLTYSRPVLGPTTPLNDAYGGLWVINAAREGVIEMNFTQMRGGINENPFAIANRSVRLDLAADFREDATPLAAVYYIVPAKDYAINGTTGPAVLNGALALFAGRDFVAADPFNHTVFFRYTLPFTPTWTGEDPASAGDLLIAPLQPAETVGVLSYPVGPYRYFWASDGNHTVVFEVTYVHGGYCPCEAPSGRVDLWENATLSAPPIVYYNQFAVNQTGAYRSGPGADIVLPLANGTLEVFDTQPALRGWVPLTLGGQVATVAGTIGYVRSPYPVRLLLPVRTSSSSGLVALDLASLSEAYAYPVGAGSLDPVGPPLSRTGQSVYTAWYSAAANTTRFVGVNGTGARIPQYSATVPGRARSVFEVFEMSEVVAQESDGSIVTLGTTYASAATANVTPTPFPLTIGPGTVVLYGGSPGGTRYGTLLSIQELRGAWTNPVNDTTALFQFNEVVTAPSPLSTRAFLLDPAMALGNVLLLGPGVAVTTGRRRSCSATACGPRPSCRRTRA